MTKKVLMVLMLLTFVSCGSFNEQSPKEQVRMVKCSSVTKVDSLTKSATFAGKVDAASEANIAFRIAGQIDNIVVSEGMFVKEGDVVAMMDDRDYKTQLAATQAEYKGVKSQVDRIKELYKSESVSPSDYDKAISGMDQIEAKLTAHTNALSDCKLRAPFDGYIQKIYFEEGEMVGAGMSILSMISNKASQIEINVPTSYYLRRGDYLNATAQIDLLPNKTFNLKLVGTTPKANLSGLYSMRFNVMGNEQPTPGMVTMVTVNYSGENNTQTRVPLSAINENNVWVVNGNVVTKHNINVITILSDGSAVVEGLDGNETIVTAGVASLKEGQKVRIMAASSENNIGGLL